MTEPPMPKSDEFQERELRLKEREADRTDRQMEWDHHWSKVWAPLVTPGLLALIGTIVTAGITFATTHAQDQQTERERTAQLQQTQRAADALDHQKNIENARAAAAMYFDKLADFRKKDRLTPAEQKRYVNGLNIVAILGDNANLREVLVKEAAEAAAGELEQSADRKTGLQRQGPDQAVRGLPDLVAEQPQGQYAASSFLAFPQVPAGAGADKVDQLVAGLSEIGFRVQPTQHMAAGRSPSRNEVRYYRPDQKKLAETTAKTLASKLGMPFVAKPLSGASLPNGVMEIWLGTGSKPT